MYVFAFSTFPDNPTLDSATPLSCAGIIVYSPMRYFQMIDPGKSFGVAGLGGLGHMAVKFGKDFGLKVTIISMSTTKEKEAREALEADHFLISKDQKQMQVCIHYYQSFVITSQLYFTKLKVKYQ